MCRKLVLLTSFVLALGLVLTRTADGARPRLVGWWRFDGDTLDHSGLGNDGTAVGNPTFVPGKVGSGAVDLDGKSDYVVIDAVADDIKSDNITLSAWLKTTSDMNTEWFSCNTADRDDVIKFVIQSTKAAFRTEGVFALSNTTVNDGQWHFLTLVLDGFTGHVYVDGVEENSHEVDLTFSADDLWSIGQEWDSGGPGAHLAGTVDDARIHDGALTAEQVRQVMMGIPPGAAFDPSPADEATDVPRDVTFSWTPGEHAALVNGHTFYLSDNFNDVNDGVGGITQSATDYAPAQRLDFGTTYYWRVDEVNDLPAYTVYEGKVWSFATELFAYPIENVAATASSAGKPEMGPENTVNGSGLDDNDLHSNKERDVWLSGIEPLGAWIRYEFDKVYILHEMWVWNSNQTVESFLGFGVKDVTIDYSTNGTDYTTLGTTHNSNWGGIMPQYGLSEVRFFQIPVSARDPYPDSGATGVDLDTVLGWTAGREAAKHDVYFSSDEQAVIDGTAAVTSMTQTSYDPLSLDLGKTYYWRVDEVNEAEAPSTWEGAIWSFTTIDFLVVDDIESYNDLAEENPASNRVYLAWIDGFGTTTNGAVVGNLDIPLTERGNVHGGLQAMPYSYDNNLKTSEATLTLATRDWTEQGVTKLSLWFRGDSANAAERMFVALNGNAVVYHDDPAATQMTGWNEWVIDLTAFAGVDLTNVNTLTIGFGTKNSPAAGGTGTIYFDDIRLIR
ncbi:MAG: LamG domain-containing protein [Planctomycetota bacterium]|jgi:hypothetical protein